VACPLSVTRHTVRGLRFEPMLAERILHRIALRTWGGVGDDAAPGRIIGGTVWLVIPIAGRCCVKLQHHELRVLRAEGTFVWCYADPE